jgi:hypothetical protein
VLAARWSIVRLREGNTPIRKLRDRRFEEGQFKKIVIAPVRADLTGS